MYIVYACLGVSVSQCLTYVGPGGRQWGQQGMQEPLAPLFLTVLLLPVGRGHIGQHGTVLTTKLRPTRFSATQATQVRSPWLALLASPTPAATALQACLQSPALFELLPPLDFPYQQPPPQLRIWLSTPMPSASALTHQQQQPAPARQQAPASIRLLQHAGGFAATAPGRWSSSSAASRRSSSNSSGLAWAAKEYVFEHGDLPGLLEQALQDNSVRIDDQKYLLPFNKALWEHAQETQAAWRDAALPPKCRFFNLYGEGLLTPYSCQYGSWWRPVRVRGSRACPALLMPGACIERAMQRRAGSC